MTTLAADPALAEAAARVQSGGAAGGDDAPLDLVLVGVFPDCDAPSGALADALTRAFAAARDARARVRPGGTVVLLVADEPEAAAAAGSLARSLALEWAADGVRVNAVRCTHPGQAADAVAWLCAPPARMLTGAVVTAR